MKGVTAKRARIKQEFREKKVKRVVEKKEIRKKGNYREEEIF